MAQALDPVIADDQVAAGLPASRPHAPPPAQAHGHARSGVPGSIGKMGAVRSKAWICDFSSTHKTTARSGGLSYSPTTSLRVL